MTFRVGDGDGDLRRRLLVRIGAPLTASAGSGGGGSFVPPKGVQRAAQRGLDLLKEGRGGSGLTDVGRARGKQLAGGGPVSIGTLRKMRAYFARHQADRKPDWGKKGDETPGYVAWCLWGGDPGASWAESVVARFDKELSAEEYVARNLFDSLVSDVYEALELSTGSRSFPRESTGDML